ncbi:hypothetical protein N2152v2_002800 [Parachlorella kessleri]
MTTVPALEGLEPEALWRYFGALTQLPRPSKHEGRVLEWLKAFASERGLQYRQDKVGNIVIKRPGSGGGEQAPPVVIQGHVDMVCEKNASVDHDFHTDPLRLLREGDWVKADGTTLGSDNGIGVACALALLDLPPTAKLPPLECLFTVDEETGLTGAFGLDGSMLSGLTMLNIDTEDWGDIFIGCAGGGDSMITLRLPTQAVPGGSQLLEVAVEGLMGGHSGINIQEDRGNAVRMAASVVDELLAAVHGARLCSMQGGDKRNAIPRECTAIVAVPAAKVDRAHQLVSQRGGLLLAEYGHLEKTLHVDLRPVQPDAAPQEALSPEGADRLLTLLLTLPHGVLKNSHAVPGLVETSTNLASVRPKGAGAGWAEFAVQCSTRSSMMAPLEHYRAVIRRIANLCGGTVEQDEAYPGWAPNPASEVVELARQAIKGVTGREPEIKAIHAGLECGIIGEKVPGIDSVSYGPTIRGAHSPDERVQVSTVEPFYQATLRILESLADKRVEHPPLHG